MPLQDYPNIQVHCISKEELYDRLVSGMCLAWTCKQYERKEVAIALDKLLKMPYRMNDLKPVYTLAFADIFKKRYPGRKFSHWLRLDLDVLIGDFDALFPWEDLEHDIISFTPRLNQDARETVFRGYFTVIRLSKKMDYLMTRLVKYSSPQAFIEASASTEFVSIDEGLFSKAVLQSPDVSFKLIPGKVFLDDEANFGGATIVLVGDTGDLTIAREAPAGYALSGEPGRHLLSTSYLEPDAFTTECSVLWWIPREDHWCIRSDVPLLANSDQQGIAVRRAPGDDRIALELIEEPPLLSDGALLRPAMAVHLMDSKRPPSAADVFGPDGWVLKPDELMEIYYDRETTKYKSRFHRRETNGGYTTFSPNVPIVPTKTVSLPRMSSMAQPSPLIMTGLSGFTRSKL